MPTTSATSTSSSNSAAPATAQVADCRVLELETIVHPNGKLTVAEPARNFPFGVHRVYYVYDVPSGAERGGHGHYTCQELLVAASGSFDVVLDDGTRREVVSLNRPNRGLFIAAGIWRELHNFSGGSVLLVLASDPYLEADYLRDYEPFQDWKLAALGGAHEPATPLCGSTIRLRPVTPEDARFILDLRLNPELNRYLSAVTDDVEQQVAWIKSYQERQRALTEFYFLIESLAGEQLGTVRLYDFQQHSFQWGSWVLKPGAPRYAAVESAIAVYDFAFQRLGFTQSHFAVNRDNVRVVKFHERFGAKIVRDDERNYYFIITAEDYAQARPRYVEFLAAH